MEQTTRALFRRVLSYTVLALVSFAFGRFFSVEPPPSIVQPDGRDDALVDSLIASWTLEREEMYWGKMGMAHTPALSDARFGYFPPRVCALAQAVDSAFGTPHEVILAQFALESRFGLSDLGGNNFFGHKVGIAEQYGEPPYGYVLATTREFKNGEWVVVKNRFARYANIESCFKTHGRFLSTSPLFKDALKYNSEPARYAREIGRRYATDPDYALKLITIMRRYSLLQKG